MRPKAVVESLVAHTLSPLSRGGGGKGEVRRDEGFSEEIRHVRRGIWRRRGGRGEGSTTVHPPFLFFRFFLSSVLPECGVEQSAAEAYRQKLCRPGSWVGGWALPRLLLPAPRSKEPWRYNTSSRPTTASSWSCSGFRRPLGSSSPGRIAGAPTTRSFSSGIGSYR